MSHKALVACLIVVGLLLLLLISLFVTGLVLMVKSHVGRTFLRHKLHAFRDIVNYGLAMTQGSQDLVQQMIQWRQAHPDKKVYISLTTSPSRIKNVHKVLLHIHPGLYDAIEVHLPKQYKPTGETYGACPMLESIPKLNIIRHEVDLGPITKMIHAIKNHKAEDAIVISIDDDIALSSSRVAQLIDAIVHYGYKAVVAHAALKGGTAADLVEMGPQIETRPSDQQTKIVEGYGAVAYPVKLVDTDALLQLSQSSKSCFQSDDMVISYCLGKSGVPRIHVDKTKESPEFSALSYGLQSDALHNQQVHEKAYVACVSK